MKQTLDQALKTADLERLIPLLIDYADNWVRRYLWRGYFLKGGGCRQALAAGKSADDFVMEAFDALANGSRSYRDDLDLETNLRRTIESMVSNWKKKSDRQPLVDHLLDPSGDEGLGDPVDVAADTQTTEISEVELRERIDHQKRLLGDFRASLEGDTELSGVYDALAAEFEKPAEIEELTGIPAKRVYELKRKLKMRLSDFATNHPAAEGLGK